MQTSFVRSLAPFLLLAACSSTSSSPATTSGVDGGGTSVDAGGAGQEPPTGQQALEAWLGTGAYKEWHCEAAVHANRSPSPHGFNRICSNDVIAAAATATTAWSKGAAAVKEIYENERATTPTGYAVYLKTAADSNGGAAWYWYERIGSQVVADGLGTDGAAKSVCVGCHAGAGSDAAHTPTAGARDQVYTAVP